MYPSNIGYRTVSYSLKILRCPLSNSLCVKAATNCGGKHEKPSATYGTTIEIKQIGSSKQMMIRMQKNIAYL